MAGNGCGTEISACFADPNSMCWNVADIKEIIGDTDFIYKGLVKNEFECQADGVNYMMAFTEETNPNCNRINDLYCFKLPFNKDDTNQTKTATAPTNTDDLNTSATVPKEDIKNINDNPALYISSIDKNIGQMSHEARQFYRDNNGNLKALQTINRNGISTLNRSLIDVVNADNSKNIYDYLSQDVSSQIQEIEDKAKADEEGAFAELNDKIMGVIPSFKDDYIGTFNSCGVFHMNNQNFSILGGSTSFNMAPLNDLMNSPSVNDLFILIKIFLYFMIALASFKIFVKVG